jgi:hypothetical protein
MDYKQALCFSYWIDDNEFEVHKIEIEKECFRKDYCNIKDVAENCCLFKERLLEIISEERKN